jgi:ABC-type multidrug transport system ATPase subunit
MVCDRVAILVQGSVAMQGTMEDLTRDSRRYEISIEGMPPDWCSARTDIRAEVLPNGQTKLILTSSEPADAQPIIDRLRQEQRTIVSLRPVRETLEDLFMRAVTDPETGKAKLPGAIRNGGRP